MILGHIEKNRVIILSISSMGVFACNHWVEGAAGGTCPGKVGLMWSECADVTRLIGVLGTGHGRLVVE